MGFAHLDRYADRRSWLKAHTTPGQRLHVALLAAVVGGLMPPGAWLALGLLAVIVCVGAWSARLPAAAIARRVARLAPFFVLPALALPFSVPGEVLVEIGPFGASRDGTLRALEIISRATVSVSAITVVVSVTRATDLLAALDDLPLPGIVKTSLAMGYRYLYVLNDEADRTGRALKSRAGDAGKTRIWRARSVTLAHLLVRALDRTERVHAAMISRGYRGTIPALREAGKSAPGWSIAITALLVLVWLGGLLESLA